MHERYLRGFTLIELLVVITIIVVLLALLTPALDRAIYQAELTVCGAQLGGIGKGAVTYAMDFKRRYPYRSVIAADDGSEPQQLTIDEGNDDRPKLRGYISLNMFHDPLHPRKVDYENTDPDTSIYVGLNLYFGFRYVPNAGMIKIGDRFVWTGADPLDPAAQVRTHRLNLLAGDADEISYADDFLINSHPDTDGVMTEFVSENGAPEDASGMTPFVYAVKQTRSSWISTSTHERGLVDTNHAVADGSVVRTADVTYDAQDMIRVPMFSFGSDNLITGDWWLQVITR